MRKGSALLIVIGMVSFMIISAVSFSVYMRTSRQPSSYLRRSATSRYMLKAALANAIDRIDGSWQSELDVGLGDSPDAGFIEGVYDDPYPGLGPSDGSSGGSGGKKSSAQYRTRGNRWVNRVFSPFDDASPEDTVSTLTLEGLAYLPPALINEVRLRSRLTRTALWRHLTYEAGRYAFCAVDVSDCFDVNKVRATARTSAPNQRIGFSAMFPGGTSWSTLDTSRMSAFNSTANQVSGDGQIPFVSLADFNAFFGQSEFSPFCRYIGQSGGIAIVGQEDTAAHTAFYATDTWFPPTNSTVSAGNRFNLAVGGRSEPFDEYDEQFGVEDVLRMAGHTPLGQKIRDRLGGVGTICLYDYLDADSVPTSYALPTVETAPMVCALGLKASGDGVRPAFRPGAGERTATITSASGGKQTETVITAIPYEFDWGVGAVHVYGLAAFPFKRLSDKPDYRTSFRVEGLVRVFLAPSDVNAHLNVSSPVLPRTPADWADGYRDGVLTRRVEMVGDLTYGDVRRGEDAVRFFEGDAEISAAPQKAFWEIRKVVYEIGQNGQRTKKGEEVYYSMDGISRGENAANTAVTYDRYGLKERWWNEIPAKDRMFEDKTTFANENDLPTRAADQGKDISPLECVPHFAVWIRICDDGNRTYDYVPASAQDDVAWGRHNESENDEVLTACGSEHPPILRFSSTRKLPYGINAASGDPGDGAFGWSALYTVDPRFNYAPEAWYRVQDMEPSTLQDGSVWLQSIRGVLGGTGSNGRRDPDIFMFTSDQEYLQSMGELQFIPWTRDLERTPDLVIEDCARWKFDYQFDGSAQSVLNFMPGMWQTYSALDGDPIYTLGDPNVEIAAGRGDFRVNPFTPDNRVFMAAIANTPYDYFAASTNKDLNILGDCDPQKGNAPAEDGLRHAFNSRTSCAKWSDDRDRDDSELEKIAGVMHDEFLSAAKGWNGNVGAWPHWEDVFDDLDWYDGQREDEQRHLFGVSLDEPLHAVDRKFLHSFWRECFQNRQQLFLVFVRAEPLTVGGSGKAALASAQLGARGVALVWRDPEPPQYYRSQRPPRQAGGSQLAWKRAVNDGPPPPHRTRILFYHQFD